MVMALERPASRLPDRPWSVPTVSLFIMSSVDEAERCVARGAWFEVEDRFASCFFGRWLDVDDAYGFGHARATYLEQTLTLCRVERTGLFRVHVDRIGRIE